MSVLKKFMFCIRHHFTVIHSLVFSLEGWAWQEPEPSHVTGMALAHCILGKFLGVVCHCFPPISSLYDKTNSCRLHLSYVDRNIVAHFIIEL